MEPVARVVVMPKGCTPSAAEEGSKTAEGKCDEGKCSGSK